MDFGYDEHGNRTTEHKDHASSSEANEKNATDVRASKRNTNNATYENDNSDENNYKKEGYVEGNNTNLEEEQDNHDGGGDKEWSDFDDEVELVVGETGMQSIDEALVAPASLSSSGIAAGNATLVQNEYSRYALLHNAPASHVREQSSKYIEGSQMLQLTYQQPQQQEQQKAFPSKSSPLFTERSSAPLLSQMSFTEAKLHFVDMLTRMPARLRCAAVIGSLHHGKTSLLRMLLNGKSYEAEPDEVDRAMTIHSHVISTVASGAALQPATHVLTFIDTPGHASLLAEVHAAVRLADVICFVVDAVEGIDGHGERLLRHAILYEQLPIVLIINKLDRLITELKLPPLDAYRKLRVIIDTCNNIIASCNATFALVSPEAGTVCFASCEFGLIFSLETFALKYSAVYGHGKLDPFVLSQQLWGQVTFEHGKFNSITKFNQRPSFVTFILEPIYKIIAHSATGNGAELLSSQLCSQPNSPKDAIREAMRFFCGNPAEDGMDILLNVMPSMEGRLRELRSHYHLDACVQLPQSSAFSEEHFKEEDDYNSSNNTVMAIGTFLRVWRESEMAAVIRVVHGTLNLSENKRAVVIDSHCNEMEPFKYISITGMYMIASENVCNNDSADDEVNKGENGRSTKWSKKFDSLTREESSKRHLSNEAERLIVVERAYCGQVILMTGIDKVQNNATSDNPMKMTNITHTHTVSDLGNSISNHFVLVSGDAAHALLDEAHFTNEEDNDYKEKSVGVEHNDWVSRVSIYPLAIVEINPLIHVGIELKQVDKMQLLQRGLHKVLQGTHGIDIRTEETGEFTMSGHGELQLDCALQLLRQQYCANVKIGLSQPYVSFRETVLDSIGVLAMVGNRKTGIACTSGVLDASLARVLEYGELELTPVIQAYHSNTSVNDANMVDNNYSNGNSKQTHEHLVKLWTTLRTSYHMDALEAMSVMALGPDKTHGPSVLFDDTLEEDDLLSTSASAMSYYTSQQQQEKEGVENYLQHYEALQGHFYDLKTQSISRAHKNAIIAGFRAATSAGPLIGDTVHGVGVKLISADIDQSARIRDAVVLSTARNAIRQSLLGARPRLLEPVYEIEILTTSECTSSIRDIVSQRRGAIISEDAIPAIPLIRLKGLVPIIDSFGLETQIRVLTHGQALPSFSFAQWDRVPGDPFDSTIHVAPLEPAKGYQLARDFVLKTRFRRGLPLKLLSEL